MACSRVRGAASSSAWRPIIADRRHSGLRILREEPIDSRRFANWSFGLLPGRGSPTVTPRGRRSSSGASPDA